MGKRYYLAYGSNLNKEQMKRRCPNAKAVGTTLLKDYELLFKGSCTGFYLTVEKKKGSGVPCAVWEVTEDDEANLDFYEGYPKFYRKEDMEIELRDLETGLQSTIKAFIYIMDGERKVGMPSEYYLRVCLNGYTDFGFDDEPLKSAYLKSERLSKMDANIRIIRTCPICGRAYKDHPALSREDNRTPICPDCGTRQALKSIGVDEEERERVLSVIHRHMKND